MENRVNATKIQDEDDPETPEKPDEDPDLPLINIIIGAPDMPLILPETPLPAE